MEYTRLKKTYCYVCHANFIEYNCHSVFFSVGLRPILGRVLHIDTVQRQLIFYAAKNRPPRPSPNVEGQGNSLCPTWVVLLFSYSDLSFVTCMKILLASCSSESLVFVSPFHERED
jgi:hypothetical protein